jgi:hypothetical protein
MNNTPSLIESTLCRANEIISALVAQRTKERDDMRVERNEARLLYCIKVATHDPMKTPQMVAEDMGWDLFPQK